MMRGRGIEGKRREQESGEEGAVNEEEGKKRP